MRCKLSLVLFVLLFGYSQAQKNCNLYEVPLTDRVGVSTLVIEGIVKSSKAEWDKNRQKIYTIHEVEVINVLKGFPPQNRIKIVTQGGAIDLVKHSVTNELELKPGDAGIFMLRESTYPIASAVTLYTTPSYAQSFIKYQKEDQSARGPFDHFKTLDELNNALKKVRGINFNRTKGIPWNEVAASRIIYTDGITTSRSGNQTQAVLATISGFTPTTVQAGRDIQLTISGTGFGATQGTSYVAFKYASDGGASYIQPYAAQYVSWSDTQIVVKVPADAGTGTLLVNVGGANTLSSGTLTVDYAINNLEYTFNSVTTEYNSLLRNHNGTGGYTFKYTADVPANGKTYFEIAAKDWVCATGVDFLVSTTASTATVIADDNENTVDYQALGVASGVIAQANTYSGGCIVNGTSVLFYVDELDVVVNSSLTYYYGTATSFTGYDYYTAVLHELGHANQLGHVIDTNASPTKIMHYSLGSGQYRRTIDTGSDTGGEYWVGQSTTTSRCVTTVHKTLYCTSSVTLSTSVTSIAESGTSFTVTATQNQINFSDVVVNLAYTGTATSGSDYTSVASITIPAGSLTASATITLTDDAIYEGSETIIIDISSVTNGTENGTQQKTVSITDNEAAPTVTLSTDNTSVTEGTGTTRTVTATLSTASALATTVNLSYSGTATYATDYTMSGSGTSITIPANSLSAFLTMTITDDALYEGTETMTVDISTVTNATENGTQQKSISIFDNDTAPTVTLSGTATIAEANASTNITATLSAVSALATTVTLTISGTAEVTDYSQLTTITIPAGSTSAFITCSSIQDTIDEANETVVSDITAVTNGTESGTQKVTITITDDDASPTITIASSANTISENGGMATISATSAFVTEQDITILYSLSGTATQLTDYTTGSNFILIPAGATTSSVNVNINSVDDSLDEANETVIVDVSSVTNGTESGTQQTTVTISDDDATPTVTLTTGSSTIAETSGSTTVTATLSAISGQNVTVNLGLTGTATTTTDYTLATSITIPAGNTSASITLTSVSDALDESNESVIIDITSVTNATESGTQQQTVSITDDDATPTVTLTTGSSTIAETSGSTTVTASLSAISGQNVTVNLGLTGTATTTTDYTLATSITIPAGNTSASITLASVSDALDESNETVIIDITSVTNATESGTQQQTVSITDDDAAPTVLLTTNSGSITENGGTANIIATLSAVSGQNVTVNLGFSGTATTTTDYTLETTISIPAGTTFAIIPLTAVNDALDEADETVIIDITTVTNATESGTQLKTITITDDDAAPNVCIAWSNTSIGEGAAGTSNAIATLSAVSSLPVTINLTWSGTATLNTDYTVTGSTITIPAGSTTGLVTMNNITDTLYEMSSGVSEFITVTMASATNATIPASGACPGNATMTQNDDDTAPTVSLSASNTSIAEAAGSSILTATLSTVSGVATTVNIGFTGTAVASSDYTANNSSIVIPAGSLSASTLVLTAVQDTVYESNETIIADITSVTNATESGTQQSTVTITDDDAAPTVVLTTNTFPVAENGGTANLIATLSSVSGQDVTVTLGLSGTATAGTDYTVANSIFIPAGSTFAVIPLTAVNDFLDEPNETIVVDITSASNATEEGVQQITYSLVDDDNPPTVSLSTSVTSIAENAGTASVTATLSGVSGYAVTVNLVLGGTALVTTDYSMPTTITIPAGSTSASVTLTAVSDALDENNETVIIDIDSVTNATEAVVQQQTITINDDDPSPTVTFTGSATTISENSGTKTITLQLSAASGLDVTVNLAFSGTAVWSVDYTGASSILIPAGSTSASITFMAINDSIDEETIETVIIDVASVTNATESGTQQANFGIIDDDPTARVKLSVDQNTINETGGVANLTVTIITSVGDIPIVSGRDVTVTLGYTGTATSNTDYTASTTVFVPAGNSSVSIPLTAVGDLMDEPNETVIVDIVSVLNGFESGVQQQTITITDDDATPTVSLSTGNLTIAENAGATTVIATLSAVSGQDVTVDLGFSGTATINSDYTAATGITIPAGSTFATIPLTAIPDTIYETNESIVVAITSVTNASELGNQQLTYTINEDDAPPVVTLSLSSTSISENGGSFTVTATLSNVSALPVSVYLSYSGSAVLNDDFTDQNNAEIYIPAGQLIGVMTFTGVDDNDPEGHLTLDVYPNGIVNGQSNGTSQPDIILFTIIIIDDEITPTTTQINLKLLLEGYYDANTHAMQPVKANQGIGSSSTYVDDITVELRHPTSGALVATTTAQLQTDGTATALYNMALSGNYYIAVKHRNTVQTWSATPQPVGAVPLTYDFTNMSAKAYGANMVEVASGLFAFYTGDYNQDELVDAADFSVWEADSNDFAFGYYVTDANGDGIVDLSDYSVWEANANNFIFANYPFFSGRVRLNRH